MSLGALTSSRRTCQLVYISADMNLDAWIEILEAKDSQCQLFAMQKCLQCLLTIGVHSNQQILQAPRKNAMETDTTPRDSKIILAQPHRHTIPRHTVASNTLNKYKAAISLTTDH